MRLIDKLGHLVRASLRGGTHGKRESSGGDTQELGRIRAALEAAEKRRKSVESELADSGADGYSAQTARLERQLTELERSEDQLRSALSLIEATTSAVANAAGKPETLESSFTPVTGPGPGRAAKQQPVPAPAAEEKPGESPDLTDRKARLSGPRGSG